MVEAGYLTREKYLYGIPYLYTLSHKGRILLGANKREDKIRVDRITHDIYMIEAIIYCVLNLHLCKIILSAAYAAPRPQSA